MSWPAPSGVPKSYNRQVRELFGCYHEKVIISGGWWSHFPKRLDDVLAEYGAQVQDGKLVDANGRTIRIMKKLRGGWRWDAERMKWEDKRRELMKEQCTVLVIDIEEDE
jgi:PAS domain-containing protein